MVLSLREPFYRWFQKGFLVLLACLRLDLGKSRCISHIVEGNQFGCVWFNGLIGLDLRIFWLWLSFLRAVKESYYRIEGDLGGLCRSQRSKQIWASRESLKESRLQRISVLSRIITEPILVTSDVLGYGCFGISVYYLWLSDRCNRRAFLLQRWWRRWGFESPMSTRCLTVPFSRFFQWIFAVGYQWGNPDSQIWGNRITWQIRFCVFGVTGNYSKIQPFHGYIGGYSFRGSGNFHFLKQALVFGGVFSPVMVAAGRENQFWSYGLFGLVIGMCGLFVVGLPETRGSVLCDTMDEEEYKTLGKGQFIG